MGLIKKKITEGIADKGRTSPMKRENSSNSIKNT